MHLEEEWENLEVFPTLSLGEGRLLSGDWRKLNQLDKLEQGY